MKEGIDGGVKGSSLLLSSKVGGKSQVKGGHN